AARRKGLGSTLAGAAAGAGAGFAAVYGSRSTHQPDWEPRQHRVELFRFRTKAELLEGVRRQFQGGGSGVGEEESHVTFAGVRLPRRH
ncbi:MAG: hypothetical protein AB1758_38525, partial [Candidatus Eremiobacterota bacterium]